VFLESARRLFNKKGFYEVSIDEIMANAGLTHGGFYRQFSGKDELYAAAVRQFLCKNVRYGSWPLPTARESPSGPKT
jgi:TetR/AcrR family transcriptional regulator, transcriptional repressor for nem operon